MPSTIASSSSAASVSCRTSLLLAARWRAVVGTASVFAIYHPLLSWAPVAALGALNAMLFKRSGHLVVAVAAHMAYNAVVLGLAFR